MILNQELQPKEYYNLCSCSKAGAILQFIGVVRNHTDSPKAVKGLNYESYEELAVTKINQIVADATEKFGLEKAHCVHRVGELMVGDLAIVVTTAGAHRDQTYQGNRYIVDRVKYEAPIWKQEVFVDGTTEWGKNSTEKPSFIED